MKTIEHNQCKAAGNRGLWASLKERINQRLAVHVAACPHCQKRLALVNRVEVAFELLRTQAHPLELLSRANTRAVGVLKHSLRYTPQSQKLRRSKPELNWIDQRRPLLERMMNIAACLFVILLVRMGVTASLKDVQTKGKTALHNYYARNLDSQIMDEIFPDETSQV